MAIIGEEDREYIQGRFEAELKEVVKLNFYTRSSFFSKEEENGSPEEEETGEINPGVASQITRYILGELLALAPEKLNLIERDLDQEEEARDAVKAGLDPDRLPAIVFESAGLMGKSHYLGLPSGYEFGSLVENIIDLSSPESALKATTLEKIKTVDKPVKVLVFVTPT